MIWRVSNRDTFRAFPRGERRRRGPVVVVRVRLDGSAAVHDPPRVAYRVGRPVGTAVTRNRVRRRLRSAVRANVHRLERGHAYLVGAHPEAATAGYGEIEAALGRALAALPSGGKR